jgi:hypothetical protein
MHRSWVQGKRIQQFLTKNLKVGIGKKIPRQRFKESSIFLNNLNYYTNLALE